MRLSTITAQRYFRPMMGSGLTALCGWVLLMAGPKSWELTSYDEIFRYSVRTITNQIVLVLMDNQAYSETNLHQARDRYWSRSLHTQLLNLLADGGCPLVVLDIHFEKPGTKAEDEALAAAMRRQQHLVLMAAHETVTGTVLPTEPFLSAAHNHWGLGKVITNENFLVRQHWPVPDLQVDPSLPWVAAGQTGVHLERLPGRRWLRYYGTPRSLDLAWKVLSYGEALQQPASFYSTNIVFVGNDPETTSIYEEGDEFRIPHPRWASGSVGGVKILATEFLNLINGDWLRRPAAWVEWFLFLFTGALLGGGLGLVGRWTACLLAAGAALAVMLGAVVMSSYVTNYWFPWLFIVGGQVPCAVVWAFTTARPRPARALPTKTEVVPVPAYPDAPDYELYGPSFGRGAYGEVWLVRNSVGQWQALKAVNQKSFEQTGPYEREWRGITNYKPISDQHPGLLRIDFVSKQKPEGYFYYVMELGDAESAGWEKTPGTYRPRNLHSVCEQATGRRLPATQCAEIGLALAEALEFLHARDLTHRDIKPSNIIFVNGRPKLADVGLVTEVRPGEDVTWVGTTGYMPPPPEPPGTKQADLYALGMVLYVISTGRQPVRFPELSTTLVERTGEAQFFRLNSIILRACEPDQKRRYTTVSELRADLEKARADLGGAAGLPPGR